MSQALYEGQYGLQLGNLVLLKDFLPPYPIGATVKLKSGSPILTVTAVQDSLVEVKWFEGQEAKQMIIPVAALKPIRIRRSMHYV